MRRYISLLFVIILENSYALDATHQGWEYINSQDQSEIAYKYRRGSTNLFIEVPTVNRVLHGRMITYSKTGRKNTSIPFVMGKMNGVYLTYDESGEHIVHESSYKNNIIDGLSITYATNGAILEIREYREGKLMPSNPSWNIADTNSGGFYILPEQIGIRVPDLRQEIFSE
jgi:hypothetical protein